MNKIFPFSSFPWQQSGLSRGRFEMSEIGGNGVAFLVIYTFALSLG
jgi:hypothetical protein